MDAKKNQVKESVQTLQPTVLWKNAYKKYIRFWVNLAKTVQITEDEAQDIVHTVLIASFVDGARGFESMDHVRNYVAKGVLNRAIQLKKKNDRHQPWEEHVELRHAVFLDLATVEEASFYKAFRDGLMHLPKRDFQIIKHRFYSGLRFAEISALLGVPISTLKSREDAAIRKLRRWLRKEGY